MGELMKLSDIQLTTAITIPTDKGSVAMSVRDVIQWIAPGAPPADALRFLMQCKIAEMNPFLNEAYLINMGGKWVTVISKSGWLRRAEMHPQFNGFEAGIIVQKILRAATKTEPAEYGPMEDIEGAVQPTGYKLLGGWCKVYRNDRRLPVVARVSFNERKKSTPAWTDMPCTMIRKDAIVDGLREAGFLTSGCYDRDEIEDGTAIPATAHVIHDAAMSKAIEAEYVAVPTHQLDPKIAIELSEAIVLAGMSPADEAAMLARRGVSSVVELSDHDAREILSKLYFIIDQRDAGKILLPDQAPTEQNELPTAIASDSEVIDTESYEAKDATTAASPA